MANTTLRFIKYTLIWALLTFILLIILIGQFSHSITIFLWVMGSSFLFHLLKKRWKKKKEIPLKSTKKFPNETSSKKKKEFKPWTEEELIWKGKEPIKITYADSDFNVTERSLDIIGIWPDEDGEIYFRAFCHLRGSYRTFKAERVMHVIDKDKKTHYNFYHYLSDGLKI